MIGDFAHPAGESGRAVDQEVAIIIADRMRLILNLDLDELYIAFTVQGFNNTIEQDDLIAAWEHLNAGERRAWRNYVAYDEFLANERRKHVD